MPEQTTKAVTETKRRLPVVNVDDRLAPLEFLGYDVQLLHAPSGPVLFVPDAPAMTREPSSGES